MSLPEVVVCTLSVQSVQMSSAVDVESLSRKGRYEQFTV